MILRLPRISTDTERPKHAAFSSIRRLPDLPCRLTRSESLLQLINMISFCGCLRPPQRSSFPAANKLVVIEDRLIQILHSVLLCYTPRGRTPSPPPHYQYHIAGQTMMIELHHLSNSKMSRDQLRERLDNQVKLALYMRYCKTMASARAWNGGQ